MQDLATDPQVRETELRLQKEIKEVESRLSLEIKNVEVKVAETRADLIRWVVAVGVLQTTALTAVLLKIARLI
ncbi:hypothetical protein [Methylococcus sp. EFPC2]|uniref:hypothetical protein n=1 Tax=Methylococcus sp. EFPC2 TaxID=2812648 RepID=UPI0019686582|nr:hypothetical protein [Methylococcus sp. EFPC2]QSA96830.1 hypothetical protein JWZ97_16730 [Methylococcus sp. EFPC2]